MLLKVIEFFCNQVRYHVFLISLFFALSFTLYAQETPFKKLSVEEAINLTINNNYRIKNAQLELEKSKLSRSSSLDIPSTEFIYQYGQIHSPVNDRYITINQNFGSLLTHIYQYKTALSFYELSKVQYELAKKEVIAEVKSAYYFWQYLHQKLEILNEQKNHYSNLTRVAALHYNLGATNLLEKTTSAARQAEVEIEYNTLQDELIIARNKLKQLIVTEDEIIPEVIDLELYMIDKPAPSTAYKGGLPLSVYEKSFDMESSRYQTAKTIFFPEISAGYFNQNIGMYKGLDGWQAGLTFPLWFFSQTSKIKQAKINRQIALNSLENQKYCIESEIENLLFDLNKYFKQIIYYKEYALPQAELLIHTSEIQFNKEEIDYFEFLQGISTGIKLKMNYFETVNNYNQTAIQLEFYAN